MGNEMWVILALLGRILGAVVCALLALILLLLFIPIRYQGAAWIDDPEGRDAPEWSRLKDGLHAEFYFSWLFHLVRGSWHRGMGKMPEIRIFFFRLSIPGSRKKKGGEESGETNDQKKNSAEKGFSSAQLAKLAGLAKEKQMRESLRTVLKKTGKILRMILPKKWKVEGTVGLGGPEGTSEFMEAEAILLPFVCGHVWVLPQMEGYRFDLRGGMKGKICIGQVLLAVIVLMMNRDVQELIEAVKKAMGKQHTS